MDACENLTFLIAMETKIIFVVVSVLILFFAEVTICILKDFQHFSLEKKLIYMQIIEHY